MKTRRGRFLAANVRREFARRDCQLAALAQLLVLWGMWINLVIYLHVLHKVFWLYKSVVTTSCIRARTDDVVYTGSLFNNPPKIGSWSRHGVTSRIGLHTRGGSSHS